MTDGEPRSPLALGLMWASRVTTLGLEFSLPVLGGYYLDRWRHTSPVATLAGLVLGFAVGMMHLLQIARAGSRAR